MVNILTFFLVLAIIVHLIRPLGVPGLRKRGDVWKLPALGLILIVVLTALQA